MIDFYFQERLKARLNEKNHESINWLFICNALNDVYGELPKVYDSIKLNEVRIPAHSGHPFRLIPATHSGAFRHP
jgi:hypothetical protein